MRQQQQHACIHSIHAVCVGTDKHHTHLERDRGKRLSREGRGTQRSLPKDPRVCARHCQQEATARYSL